ncbi:hypothetical protein J6590_045038 [Homalodisca vitripennis]|nr:hypothetical protein J6590_045038 [Homalodisca vitripennis]
MENDEFVCSSVIQHPPIQPYDWVWLTFPLDSKDVRGCAPFARFPCVWERIKLVPYTESIFISDDEDAAERRDETLREEALGEPSSPLGFWRTILFNSPENMPDYSPRSTDSPDPTPPHPPVARSPSPGVARSPSPENNSASRKRRLYRSCRPRVYRFADTSSDDEEDGERPPRRSRSVIRIHMVKSWHFKQFEHSNFVSSHAILSDGASPLITLLFRFNTTTTPAPDEIRRMPPNRF